MRSSDWSSDVCSSDLLARGGAVPRAIIGGAQEAAALDDIILAACLACRPFQYIADKVVEAMLVGREAGDRRAPGKTVDRKSVVWVKRVEGSVEIGGRRILKKKKKTKKQKIRNK